MLLLVKSQSQDQTDFEIGIFSLNANYGLSAISKSTNVDITDFISIKEIILNKSIDMVLVGPEMPLINGITDFINNDPDLKHINVIGPSQTWLNA